MTDVNQLVTENLGIWTSAIEKKSSAGRGNGGGISLYGINKLRELILELAVRGKLVPQDVIEGNGEELKQAVLKERAGAIRAKRARKQKSLPEISADGVLFEIPPSWTLIRLGDLTNYGVTDKAEAEDVTDDTWVLELEDVEKVSSKLLQRVTFDERRFKSTKNRFLKGDVIYGKLRPYLDKVLVADQDGVCTTEMIPMRSYADVSPLYLWLFLKSPEFIRYADDSTHGMNLPRLGTEKARMAVVPLPPTAEQHRIVAKADELMALCDALERQAEDSLKAHQTLVESCLATLTNSQTPEELAQNWTRIEAHFDTLFTTEESVEALRTNILDLAVTGRLTRHSSGQVDVQELVAEIETERELSVHSSKSRKPKLSLPSSDQFPCEIPSSWGLVRLGHLVLQSEAGWSPKCPERPKEGDEWGVLKVSSVTWGNFAGDKNKALPDSLEPRPEIAVRPGDFVISRANTAELVARSVVVPEGVDEQLMLSDKLIRFRFSQRVMPEYLNLVNISSASRNYYKENAGGTSSSMKNVSRVQIQELVVPFPTLDEQAQIVEKVTQLFSMCDQFLGLVPTSMNIKRQLADNLTQRIH